MGNACRKRSSEDSNRIDVDAIDRKLASKIWKLMESGVKEGGYSATITCTDNLYQIVKGNATTKDTRDAIVSILNETQLKNSGLVLTSIDSEKGQFTGQWTLTYHTKRVERVGKMDHSEGLPSYKEEH